MDNPTRWNITNSAQNIVSALVDPSKQFDHVFRREWSNTFSRFSRHKPSMKTKQDAELKSKLTEYVGKLEARKHIKIYEAQREVREQEESSELLENRFTVPDVFLVEEFDLSNLDIFNQVIKASKRDKKILNIEDGDDEQVYNLKPLSKSQLKALQQDFTDYLDIIEEKLASQISNRSGDFFQVMSSVDSVMDELSLAIKSVTSLRKKCLTLNDALILPNMKNIHLSKTRNNAQIVLDKMNEIASLSKVQPMIQVLLSTSDFVGALDLIANSRIKLHKELKRVICLKHLESQLVEIERVIGTMMQQEFVTLITSEWNRPLSLSTSIASDSTSAVSQNTYDIELTLNSSEANIGNMNGRLFEHERILCIVQGMIRINKLNFGEYFQQEARIAISTCVKQTIIELLSDDDDYLTTKESEVHHDVYKKVQLISYKKWINLIKIVLNNLLCILRRVKVVYSVISTSLDEVHQHLSQTLGGSLTSSIATSCNNSSIRQKASTNSPSTLNELTTSAMNQQSRDFINNFEALDNEAKQVTVTNIKTGKDGLKASLLTVCSFAEQLTLNLIECRIRESNFDKLLATEFINLSKLVENFAIGFSEICGRNSLTLLSLLQTQAEKFVNKFHEERKKRIESNLDIEQWKMVEDVPQDFQRLISQLVDENISISGSFSTHYQKQQSVLNSKHHSRASSDAAVSAVEGESLNHSSQQQQQANGSKQVSLSGKLVTNNSASNLSKLQQQQQQNQKFNNSKISYVTAGGSTYVIVNSVINLIRIVMDYCKCAHDIRSLSAELLERLFKILQLYNSKTFHLVYSAGAIQVAGLKTITTRSLVVSQRSLKLIILLIPAIYEHFSHLLPNETNRLRRFDEIKLSYEDHAAKIPERVNSIVRDVINLQLQEWEAKPPVPSPQFIAVAQHLMRLHDNIQDALPVNELKLLFAKISETFKDVLIMHLRRLNISNDAGPQQWLVTQELTFYKISWAKLNAFKGWELDYDDLWTKLNQD